MKVEYLKQGLFMTPQSLLPDNWVPCKRLSVLATRGSHWTKDLEDRDAKVWKSLAFAAYNASTHFDILFCTG